MAAVELQNTSLRDLGSLIAYWRLESVSAEVGGFTLTNNNTVTFGAAKFNNGADQGSSNTNKYLSITNNLGITGGNFTFNCWIKQNTEVGAGAQFRFWTQEESTNDTRLSLRYSESGGTYTLGFYRTKVGVGDQKLDATISALGTTQHMVTFTYNGTNIEGYLDGSSLGTAAASGTGSGATDLFYIGMHEDGSSVPSSAIFDDFAVFNAALSTAQISGLYNGTLAGRGGGAGFLLNFV